MTTLGSRYRLHEYADGFCVEGDDRPPVEVLFRPLGLEAFHVSETGRGERERFGFWSFGKLLEFVARGLLREWRPHDGWYGAREWARRQTARAIARRLRESWLRLVTKADPTVLAVQKAVFAATFGDAPLAWTADLYRDRYLVQDVVRFGAAAVAVRNAEDLTRDLAQNRLLRSAPADDLRALAKRLGLSMSFFVEPADPSPAEQVEMLLGWKDLFSDTGHAYRSLNRTLMNLPGRVPHRLVCALRFLHLERPVESRLELLAVTLYERLRRQRADHERGADHSRLFMHARAESLREAIRRVGAHQRQKLSAGRVADVKQALTFLADYPDPHNGNVVGLAERAIRWHRDRQREQIAAMLRVYGAATATVAPPVAPPAGVRFLDTVGAICAEAEAMQHCVASYVEQAVNGSCYLFHVHHRGEDATVEVGFEGRVRQSQGPRNQSNRASAYGKRVLGRWAKRLPLRVPGVAEVGEDLPF
jgi:hypothetical protein